MGSKNIVKENFTYCGKPCEISVYIDQDYDRWVKVTWQIPDIGQSYVESEYRPMESDVEDHIDDVWGKARSRIDDQVDQYMDTTITASSKIERLIIEESDAKSD